MAGEDPVSTNMIRRTDELLRSSAQRLMETERHLKESDEILNRESIHPVW